MLTSRKGPPTEDTANAEATPVPLVARTIRRRRNLTLEQVAQAAGLSRGHLSRYERGKKPLSLAALMRLAKALRTSVSTLLGEDAAADFLHVVRSSEQAAKCVVGSGGEYTFVALNRSGDHTGASAFMLQLGTSTIGEQAFHEGEEMFYVLHGAVEITLGTRSVRLGEGDFAEFPGMVRHQLRGLETGTRVLVVITERGLT